MRPLLRGIESHRAPPRHSKRLPPEEPRSPAALSGFDARDRGDLSHRHRARPCSCRPLSRARLAGAATHRPLPVAHRRPPAPRHARGLPPHLEPPPRARLPPDRGHLPAQPTPRPGTPPPLAHRPPRRMLKKAHLLRWRPRPHAQRGETTPRVRPSGAASHLDLFEHPASCSAFCERGGARRSMPAGRLRGAQAVIPPAQGHEPPRPLDPRPVKQIPDHHQENPEPVPARGPQARG